VRARRRPERRGETWRPRYRVQKAEGIGGAPIIEDEPVLVIRAQDVLARPMLREYIRRYLNLMPSDAAVVVELAHQLDALDKWQQLHRTKVADR
jgi:hypothetical protein